jgi:CheY-like chemotaxis protein
MTKILVVDDEIDVADSLVELFEAMGHEVAVGYHGGQALALRDTFDPHIVFLDLQMPVVDGFEAARSIRRSTRSGHPFLVALTALRGAEMERAAIGAGFDLYVHKPADTNVLLTLVASLEDRDPPSKPKV